MTALKNSTTAFGLVALLVAAALMTAAITWPDKAIEVARDAVKSAASVVVPGLIAWAVWILRDRHLYDGWKIVVTDRLGVTSESAVPPAVARQWIAAQFGDWGPTGWRDITGTLVRRTGCGQVNVDAQRALAVGVLKIDWKIKKVCVNYQMLPAETPKESAGTGNRI